jgi:hypothetical protein
MGVYLIYIPLDVSLEVVSLDHMEILFLVFWESFTLFSIVIVLLYIHPNSVWGFFFAHILGNICRCLHSWW